MPGTLQVFPAPEFVTGDETRQTVENRFDLSKEQALAANEKAMAYLQNLLDSGQLTQQLNIIAEGMGKILIQKAANPAPRSTRATDPAHP